MKSGQWTWSDRKNELNRAKHHLSFETASLVFADPYNRSFPDPCDWEERWQTFGEVQGILIVVIHTEPVLQNGRILQQGRIISARKATKNERRAFEEYRYE